MNEQQNEQQNVQIKMDAGVVVHLWNHCHHCHAEPIIGRRYECQSCPSGPDIDLCEPCYELWGRGEVEHPAKDSVASDLTITEHRFEMFEGKPLASFQDWLLVKHPVAADPIVPKQAVLRPIFSAGVDSVIGSYAFVARLEGAKRPLILTALHVMDELIKKLGIDCSLGREDDKIRNYTGKELPAVVTEVNLFDVFAANWMMAPIGNGGPMLVLPDAATGAEEPYSNRDIAAFWVHSADAGHFNPLPLAQSAPRVGEPVWLAARRMDNSGKRTLKAVVVECTERSLVFKYEGDGEKPKYTSGAPILNGKGEVVGINVGGGRLNEENLGHANHIENIRRHLSNAS